MLSAIKNFAQSALKQAPPPIVTPTKVENQRDVFVKASETSEPLSKDFVPEVDFQPASIHAVLIDDHCKIITLDNVLTPSECTRLIEISESRGFAEASLSVGANQYIMATGIRNNDRVIVDDTELARILWERVKPHLPQQIKIPITKYASASSSSTSYEEWELVDLNERLRIYRYTVGQYFAPHYDGAFPRSDDERSHLTLIFYLNSVDGQEGGGETNLWLPDRLRPFGEKDINPDIVIKPEPGKALLFKHRTYHEGAIVKSGIKYALRTDVMYRRVWEHSVSKE